MANTVLYRKYRSRSLDEVIGQDHIRDTLKSALKNNKLAHAYLFVGPRGVGKTSVARILAFEANKLKYSDSGHIDIIEIDAASNRRIDEIREIRDKIHIAPMQANYKVYIIDEVHMLTREAFNALLKTLEEPPAHAVFILATTEAHKVPETISSRTQRFVFRPIPNQLITQQLKAITKEEKIIADEDALEMIAGYGKGSFRDSIGLLDQLSAHNQKIELNLVRDFLGRGSDESIGRLINAVESGEIDKINGLLAEMLSSGSSINSITGQLVEELLLRPKTLNSLNLIDSLLSVESSTTPHIALEVELQRAALTVKPEANQTPAKDRVAKSSEELLERVEEPTKTSAPIKTEDNNLTPINDSQWAEVLSAVKTENNALYAVLRMAQVEVGDKTLKLTFPFKFHASRFEDKKLMSNFNKIVDDFFPNRLNIEVGVDNSIKPEPIDITETNYSLDTPASSRASVVLDTFGGGEVVEL